MDRVQIGIDFGGTKIEAAALDPAGEVVSRLRVDTPKDYDEAIMAITDLVRRTEVRYGQGTVGIGVPGSIAPDTGMMRNANTTYLNGRRFQEDVSEALKRDVLLENDANCLALSEAWDGAAAGSPSTFAIIVGTGCGGGVVVGDKVVSGGNGIAGEWGHVPLPWRRDDEPRLNCWCGQSDCLESWISGPGFTADHRRRTGYALQGADIVDAARKGDVAAVASLDDYVDRLARAIAMIANILDPHCFVVGGGMSNIDELYERVPPRVSAYTFGNCWAGRIVPARWGDSSGVRGAARLWS